MPRRLAFLLAGVLGLAACTPDEAPAPTPLPATANPDGARAASIAEVRQTLDALAADGLYGVARLVVEDSVVLHQAYGLRDRDTGETLTTATGFTIGSITKDLTAATVLALVEQERLALADSVGHFFPDVDPALGAVTLEQLLTHTGGLPEYLDTEGDYELITRDQALERAAALRFAPGTDTAYSNAGYSVLAAILAEATGGAYEAAVREAVLLPAGTPRIGYGLAGWTAGELAVGYDGDRRWGTPLDPPWLGDGPPWGLRGNGGLLATAEDLSRWFEAVFAGRVLGPDALETFKTLSGGPGPYGHRVGTGGGNDVFNAQLEMWPDAGVVFTFVTSRSDYTAEDAWDALREPIAALAAIGARPST